MQKLEKSGLPLFLSKNKLVFGEGVEKVLPAIRTLKQMKPVLLNKKARAPQEFYYMYRNVCLQKDAKKIFESNLRYDLTVIPPAVIGKEFVKTLGHFHPTAPNSGVCFPEVYEVVFGTAHFLLQTEKDFVVVKATAGEKVIMPPGYGHITVNPSKKTLVMSNWVEKNFQSIYGPFKEKGGAMYFETTTGWEKNKNYTNHAKIRTTNPVDIKEFGLKKTSPMYKLVNDLEKLDFLKSPKNYLKVFERFLE